MTTQQEEELVDFKGNPARLVCAFVHSQPIVWLMARGSSSSSYDCRWEIDRLCTPTFSFSKIFFTHFPVGNGIRRTLYKGKKNQKQLNNTARIGNLFSFLYFNALSFFLPKKREKICRTPTTSPDGRSISIYQSRFSSSFFWMRFFSIHISRL